MSEAARQISGKQNGWDAHLSSCMPNPLERLLMTNVQTAAPGQFLLFEGDESNSVFCLLSGWLSLSKCLPDGETQIIDFALPGEIIETGGGDGSISAVSIEALTDVSVGSVPACDWDDIKRLRPDLARISRKISAAACARSAGRMLRLGRGRAEMRLAYALLEMNIRLEAIGQAVENRFHIPMNQRVLGDFVGLSSVHVCRILGQLVGKGIILTGGHMDIEILKPALLAELAGVDLDTLRCEILAETDHLSTKRAHPAYA